MDQKNKSVHKQTLQDYIWEHYQNKGKGAFDLSYTRLQFLAERCLSGKRVLNIGVGSGYLEKLLIDRKVEVYTLDPSAESIMRIQEELKMGDRAKQGYSYKIPFDTGYFDKVIMTEVLEHISDEFLDITLSEVRRVLKLGGEFTGTVPFREILQANEVFCPHCQKQFHRWGHHQSFDVATLRSLLIKHHFHVKHLLPRSFPDFKKPGLRAFLKAVFRYILGRMGEEIIGPNLYFAVVSI